MSKLEYFPRTIEYPKGKAFFYSDFCIRCQIEFPFICSACPNCGRTNSFKHFPRYSARRERKLFAMIEKLYGEMIQKELQANLPSMCDLR